MLEQFVGHEVVVDMRSAFVCLGRMHALDDHWLELTDADLHDLRDTHTSRENYVAAARDTGIKRNRKRVLLVRGDMVAVSRLEDVVDK
jgi:small nuclear ribonucleoprotein (snRNP)-like protein